MQQRLHSLSFKVTAIFLLLTIVSVGVLNVLAYVSSSGIFQRQALKSMESILVFRGDMLKDQLAQLESQAVSIAKIEALQMSITSLRSGWKTIEKNSGDAGKELTGVFVSGNPNPADQREKLIKPEGPSGFYYSSHEKTQTEVAGFLKDSAFSDLLIADLDGNVIYSYKKTDAFAQNVAAGAWAERGIGIAFRTGKDNTAQATEDSAPSSFSGLRVEDGTPAIFFAVPVIKMGAPKGIVLFQVRDDIIAGILAKGLTSESSEQAQVISADGRVVGLDAAGKLVTLDPAPFTFATDAFASDAMTVADFARADGKARSYSRRIDYDGEKLLVVESVLDSELNEGSWEIAGVLVVSGLAVLVALSLITGLFAHRLFAPLSKLAGLTRAVAEGKVDTAVGNQERKDEIGTLARALEHFRHSLIEQREMEAASVESRQQSEMERLQRAADRDAEARLLQLVVEALDEGLHNLADGNLAFQIDRQFPPELESLRVNFNQAMATLCETLSSIGGNSLAVRLGSEQMRGGADRLAERTDRQASSITETVAAIGAITQAVRVQISRGEQAEKIAAEAKRNTEESGQVMQETISAMEAIQTSSRQINQIINVIDEIAFQTNLLALNAGVEAARAGESGKGFAVVAQEVRELAQRSSNAAKEISDLLQKSTVEVESGVALVERAGQALTGIGEHVEAINGRIHEIMSSTREQADTLQAIGGAVSELDTVTQQNAGMVQDTTSAIRRLAAEAGEMDQRLGQFVLADGGRQAQPATPQRYRRAG